MIFKDRYVLLNVTLHCADYAKHIGLGYRLIVQLGQGNSLSHSFLIRSQGVSK